jgi:hypothetical protein
MDGVPVEKRIGKRRQIRSVPMAWVRDPRRPDPSAADRKPDGKIVELSISGLGIVAITHPHLEVGSPVLIVAAGELGRVVVRRIDPDRYPNESYYGVEFAHPNSPLAKVLHAKFLPRDSANPLHFAPRA